VKPSVGRLVHYVSFGTPDGEYPKACRAAVITEVVDDEHVGLAVLNPGGLFFDGAAPYNPAVEPPGGTWHWPERVGEPVAGDPVEEERKKIAAWLRTIAFAPLASNPVALAERIEEGSY
jgi:hypothetical protein